MFNISYQMLYKQYTTCWQLYSPSLGTVSGLRQLPVNGTSGSWFCCKRQNLSFRLRMPAVTSQIKRSSSSVATSFVWIVIGLLLWSPLQESGLTLCLYCMYLSFVVTFTEPTAISFCPCEYQFSSCVIITEWIEQQWKSQSPRPHVSLLCQSV